MSFSVDQVDAKQNFIDFRHHWLRPGKPRETAVFQEDLSANSYHFAARSNGKIIGIVSYFQKVHEEIPAKRKSYQLRGMAVDKQYRNQDIGRSILNTSIALLKSKKVDLIWCNVRQESQLFYHKNDFQSLGDYFLIPAIGQHILMYKYI